MELVGNADIRRRLAASVGAGLAPSYLFAGPKGVGKGQTALWFAACALCQNFQAPQDGSEVFGPCGACSACKRVFAGEHPDVFHLERIEGKASLGVDDIRQGIAQVQSCSFEGSWRFWIISQAERLTEEAQSALLKTLEEPPRNLIMVLAVTGNSSLLPTVVSRCRLFNFQAVDVNELSDFLVSKCYMRSKAEVAARISGGSPGYALSMLQSEEMWHRRSVTLDQADTLVSGDMWDALQAALRLDQLNTNKDDPKRDLSMVLEYLASYYRDAICLQAQGSERLVVNVDRLPQLNKLAAAVSLTFLEKSLENILQAAYYLERNVNSKLFLQNLCLELSSRQQ